MYGENVAEELLKTGGRIHPNLTIDKDGYGGQGLFTKHSIFEDAELFAVPQSCMLELPGNLISGDMTTKKATLALMLLQRILTSCTSSIFACESCRSICQCDDECCSSSLCASQKAEANQLTHLESEPLQNMLVAYLASLPEPCQLQHVPLFWPLYLHHKVQKLLHVSPHTQAALSSQQQELLDEYGNKVPALLKEQFFEALMHLLEQNSGNDWPPCRLTIEHPGKSRDDIRVSEEIKIPRSHSSWCFRKLYFWARAVVASRAIHLWNGPALVPYADFLNHVHPPNVVCMAREEEEEEEGKEEEEDQLPDAAKNYSKSDKCEDLQDGSKGELSSFVRQHNRTSTGSNPCPSDENLRYTKGDESIENVSGLEGVKGSMADHPRDCSRSRCDISESRSGSRSDDGEAVGRSRRGTRINSSNDGSSNNNCTNDDSDYDASSSSGGSSTNNSSTSDDNTSSSHKIGPARAQRKLFVAYAIRDIPAGTELTWNYCAHDTDLGWLLTYGFVPSDMLSSRPALVPVVANAVGTLLREERAEPLEVDRVARNAVGTCSVDEEECAESRLGAALERVNVSSERDVLCPSSRPLLPDEKRENEPASCTLGKDRGAGFTSKAETEGMSMTSHDDVIDCMSSWPLPERSIVQGLISLLTRERNLQRNVEQLSE